MVSAFEKVSVAKEQSESLLDIQWENKAGDSRLNLPLRTSGQVSAAAIHYVSMYFTPKGIRPERRVK